MFVQFILRIEKSYTHMKNKTMFTKLILILSHLVLGSYCNTIFNCKDGTNCGINIGQLIVNQENPEGKWKFQNFSVP